MYVYGRVWVVDSDKIDGIDDEIKSFFSGFWFLLDAGLVQFFF